MEHTEAGGRLIEGILERLKSSARVELAFGQSRAIGDKTIIPIATIGYGFGGGAGFGSGPAEGIDGEEAAVGTGGGSGGGGGVSVTPVAVMELGPEGTRLLPIIDWTKLATRAMCFLSIWGIVRVIKRR